VTNRDVLPPRGGLAPPQVATLPDGSTLSLRPLAEEVSRRYLAEFPDEHERYGNAGAEWCIHDNQHILNWAFLSATGRRDLLEGQLAWLAGVLEARGYPVERLNRDLEIAAAVLREMAPGAEAAALALESSRS
jgi:hypothetical protein